MHAPCTIQICMCLWTRTWIVVSLTTVNRPIKMDEENISSEWDFRMLQKIDIFFHLQPLPASILVSFDLSKYRLAFPHFNYSCHINKHHAISQQQYKIGQRLFYLKTLFVEIDSFLGFSGAICVSISLLWFFFLFKKKYRLSNEQKWEESSQMVSQKYHSKLPISRQNISKANCTFYRFFLLSPAYT